MAAKKSGAGKRRRRGAAAEIERQERILKVQSRQMERHGLGGVSIDLGDDDGDTEAVILARIKASAPGLRPDGPMPANPIL